MSNLSNATIEGFITHDPEIKLTKTKKNLCTFSLAIPHFSKPSEPPRVSFIEVEAWDAVATKAFEDCKRTNRVQVTGVLRQDRWEDEKGKVNSRLKIIANEIIVLKN